MPPTPCPWRIAARCTSLLAVLLLAAPVRAQGALPLTGEHSLERGQRYASSSGEHYLVFQDDGNLVVYTVAGQPVWALQAIGVDYRHSGRAVLQADGNFALYAPDGAYLWSALTADPDPSARLDISSRGGLRLISDRRGVLWSSDGDLSPDPPATSAPTPMGSWQVHEGSAGRHTFGRTIDNGDNEGFLSGAQVPEATADGWAAASSDGLLNWAGPGGTPCRRQANYTYFQTFVEPAPGERYELAFQNVDDAARVSVTAGTGTVNVPDLVGLRETPTMDLTPFMEAGVVNRVVVTLADVCGAGHSIRAALRTPAEGTAAPASRPASAPRPAPAPAPRTAPAPQTAPAPRPTPTPTPQAEPAPQAESDSPPATAPQAAAAPSGFPFTARQTVARGSTVDSPSGAHRLIFQDGGNLVVTTRDGGYLWGFDRLAGLDYRQVAQVGVQADGNFVATDANGRVVWRALTANPDPAARLELNSRGGLQLVSPSRGVLWSSDGVLLADGVAGRGFPFSAGQTIPQGETFASPSGNHVLTFQDGGNLVVASPGGSFVWGFNGVSGLDFRQVRRVQMSNDGNLVALDASGKTLWKALDGSPDPSARLELTYGGALQLVSASRGILWSSDGILTAPLRVATTPANTSPCEAETGWSKCVQMADPSIKIMGTPRVTDSAMRAVANVYTELFGRLKPAFPRSTFDGFRVYITNGESEQGLAALPVVGDMWTDGYSPRSRATLRGGASTDYLWISEQMICKEGLVTRNDDFRAGRVSAGDDTYRSYDQVIHELGHSIDFRYNLMETRLRAAYRGDPTEQFPQGIQAWFGAPVREMSAPESALLNDLFSSRAVFSCEGYTP